METHIWKHLINGRLTEGEGGPVQVFDPAAGEPVAEFAGVTARQALSAARSAKEAFPIWAAMSIAQRETLILRFAELMDSHREELIDLLIRETGKPYDNAAYDFKMLPDCLRYFNQQAKHLDDKIIRDYDGKHLNMTIHKPIGVVVGYLAWNFPILNLGYKLGPVLASGCTCVIKPASATPLTALRIAELSLQAGFPAGVINVVAGDSREICPALNESTIPDFITLIGSSDTGRSIIAQSATSIKHFSLELGGNAPVVVMADADVKSAALRTADAKFGNAGQVCVCPNRIFVHESCMEEFVRYVLDYAGRITLGSGREQADVLMGPLVSQKAQEHMQELVDDAVLKGAKVLCGGKKADRPGYFYEPTVLSNVSSNMRVYQEEIFGPIMPLISFGDEDKPAVLANDTPYGLAAYLYTNNLKAALNLSREFDFGNVCVNKPFYNYNLPHGGCKQSGIGKDCSTFSFEEYFYVQRISMEL